jgi:hypothetical protein
MVGKPENHTIKPQLTDICAIYWVQLVEASSKFHQPTAFLLITFCGALSVRAGVQGLCPDFVAGYYFSLSSLHILSSSGRIFSNVSFDKTTYVSAHYDDKTNRD